MAQNFFKFLRGTAESSDAVPKSDVERSTRRSNGLSEFTKKLSGQEGCCVLDLGSTSAANITYFTNLGQRTYSEDVLFASRDESYLVENSEGHKVIDPDRFLAESLQYERELFDAVLMWDMPDYLNEALVKPVVLRISQVMKPGGLLLAFFHTKDAGPDAPYHRYHIAGNDTLQLQNIPVTSGSERKNHTTHFRLQRVFNNRHIENLFHDYASIKFFLGRDNIREVLVVR